MIENAWYKNHINLVNDEQGYLLVVYDGGMSYYFRTHENQPIKADAEEYSKSVSESTILYGILMGLAHTGLYPETRTLYEYCKSYLRYMADDEKEGDRP